VVFPGGFGTLDELFEILTLQQTGKAPGIPTVLVDRDYWQSVINVPALLEHGMIEAQDTQLFRFAADAEEAWSLLAARGIGARDAP
jgi:predicted Rossmann-fold nucleotide-binding protein